MIPSTNLYVCSFQILGRVSECFVALNDLIMYHVNHIVSFNDLSDCATEKLNALFVLGVFFC